MAEQDLSITPPSIAQSASIATVGKSWEAIGVTGAAAFNLPLPLSAGRGFDPGLSLGYSSQAGNGPFGIGWHLNVGAISRQTSKGVPRYLADDVMLGVDGEEWRPLRDPQGEIVARVVTHYRDLPIGEHRVVRYYPRTQSLFEMAEFWRSDENSQGFWLLHGSDGSLNLFGKTEATRRFDPQDPQRVAMWYLQESLAPNGEHIVFEYKAEPKTPERGRPHDYQAQRYLHRVLYGNVEASRDLYGWNESTSATTQWHFHLLFDYGERTLDLGQKPVYGEPFADFGEWLLRSDRFHSYSFGFETGTRRLCRQVLMFHHFPRQLGTAPVLTRRLLLEYQTTALGYNQLSAAHYQAYDASGVVEDMPPVEFDYSPFEPATTPRPFFEFERMPGLSDRHGYQCVDLYGEGVPGFLCQYDQAWYYREPLRAASGPNDIGYGPWTLLDKHPVADGRQTSVQALMDVTGDGRLDWVIAQPGMSGYQTLNADRSWARFLPFAGFPVEYFHTLMQLGDWSGDGLDSCALIGPRSVRLYANRRELGFAGAEEVFHAPDDDRLPLFSNVRSELVMLSNLLGSDMPELCRIRHDEIKCWPNLGHGRFGEGFVLCALPFDYGRFDAARVRIADLDGSGAGSLIYLQSEHFEVYFNLGGNGLEQEPLSVPWPDGVRYDSLCQVTLADLQGLGCASLILTVPHMTPRHWRYDFVDARPYLANASNNNMGCSTELVYRSSAQEWLDEKPAVDPVCHLPFAVQVVSQQRQLDEITGNCLTRNLRYLQGYYDGRNREFRGFGQVQQSDSEALTAQDDSAFTAPSRTCTWFHTGRLMDLPGGDYFNRDPEARPLGKTLLCRYHPSDDFDEPILPADEVAALEVARALAGSVLRVEVYAAEDDPAQALPFSIEAHRYKVRQLHEYDPTRPLAGRLLPSLLETLHYQYERILDDPLCQHTVHLTQDAFGFATHSINVSYARRRSADDPPPYTDPDEQRWWRDAHDPAQQAYYLNESRAEFIHLDHLEGWRLGLPYRQRGNAWVLPKGQAPAGLNPDQINYEDLLLHQDSAPWKTARALTRQSLQRYIKTDGRTPLPDGQADFEALSGPLEIAQMDQTALLAYSAVPPPFDIRTELAAIGYRAMPLFLDPDPEQDRQQNLWSADYSFVTYAGPELFYKVLAFNETLSHGVTEATYDDTGLALINVTLPDGCTTHFEYDYHALQPVRIVDANDNVQEALYEPSGQPIALSVHGTEAGVAVGFAPLTEHQRPEDPRPGPALANPKAALQKAAAVLRKDLFSWMGQLPPLAGRSAQLLSQWIAAGYVLRSGHIRASARTRLARLTTPDDDQQHLLALINASAREPVHSAVLTADQYPDSPEQQIQISLASVDGFGRALQTRQLVEPGEAYVANEHNELVIVDGQPALAPADPRWRVSERLEYNNKGLVVRVFRPYFVNRHPYIRDASLRAVGYHDQQFYDVLGRLIKLINARGDLARETWHPWFHISEDFNDTYEAPAANAPDGTGT